MARSILECLSWRHVDQRVCRHPALAIPHLSVDHVGMLDFSGLRDAGCKGIIFDKVINSREEYEHCFHRSSEKAHEISRPRVFLTSSILPVPSLPRAIDHRSG